MLKNCQEQLMHHVQKMDEMIAFYQNMLKEDQVIQEVFMQAFA